MIHIICDKGAMNILSCMCILAQLIIVCRGFIHIDPALKEFLQPNDIMSGAYDKYAQDENSPYCTRKCVKGGAPRKCYYVFTVEQWTTMGVACMDCPRNKTHCYNHGCVTADGVERGILTFNRQLPGPSIQVCQNDMIIVDVTNKMKGQSVSIHWHGLFQVKTPWMDGVPGVTNCPILEKSTFRYSFCASEYGTLFGHSHDGTQLTDGLSAPLIVRRPKESDPLRDMYDHDLPSHVIHLTDWMHMMSSEKWPGLIHRSSGMHAESYLINGRGLYKDPGRNISTNTPYTVFHVKPNKRYRFRIIGASSLSCPMQITFEGHKMTVFHADGTPIEPWDADTVVLLSGERFDVVIDTRGKPVSTYWILVQGVPACPNQFAFQIAALKYEGTRLGDLPRTPIGPKALPRGDVFNAVESSDCRGDLKHLKCMNEINAYFRTPEKILKPKADVRDTVAFDFSMYDVKTLMFNDKYLPFYNPASKAQLVAMVDNISLVLPSAPLLTQPDDTPDYIKCDPKRKCTEDVPVCECLNVFKVKTGQVVELLVVDASPHGFQITHPWHWHGVSLFIFKQGLLDLSIPFTDAVDKVWAEIDSGKILEERKKPVEKDTIGVPADGWTYLRFLADNPGCWIAHCHYTYHAEAGMAYILQIGEKDEWVKAPPNFPKCGNYLAIHGECPVMNDPNDGIQL